LTCGKIHHDVALFQAPADALPVTPGQLGLNHFAAQVENLADLKEAYEEFQAKGVRLDHNTDHGMTSSMYFFAPDGNRIEYFCNNQDDPAVGLALMGDVTRRNKELVLS
jgi:catechol-2,3-dioxygenase